MVRDATLTANTAVDVTPPSITLTAPSVDEIVELGSSEMAVYSCADDALATCVGDVANGDPIDTSGVGPHSLTVNATDTSGNAATLTHTYTVVDSTNPTISLSTPSAGATYDLGQSVNAAYSCSDLALSTCLGGVAAGTAIDTSAPGPHSFTVNAVDTSTNHASATSSYSVTNNIASSLLPAGSPPMTITNVPSGYTVSVTDANDPADGVTVAVSGIGAAKVTMSVCGGFTVRIAPGSIVTLTCASIKAKVLQGSVQLETPDATVTLSLVSGGQAELKGSGDVVVAAGSTPATVTAGGVSQTLPPGSSAAWRASGFYQPVDMNGVWNTMKGGSTVPVKFELFYGTAELTNPSAVTTAATQVSCPAASVPTDTIEELTTELAGLRYDTAAGNFHLNWKSPKQPGTCWKITVTEGNASLAAYFKLS